MRRIVTLAATLTLALSLLAPAAQASSYCQNGTQLHEVDQWVYVESWPFNYWRTTDIYNIRPAETHYCHDKGPKVQYLVKDTDPNTTGIAFHSTILTARYEVGNDYVYKSKPADGNPSQAYTMDYVAADGWEVLNPNEESWKWQVKGPGFSRISPEGWPVRVQFKLYGKTPKSEGGTFQLRVKFTA